MLAFTRHGRVGGDLPDDGRAEAIIYTSDGPIRVVSLVKNQGETRLLIDAPPSVAIYRGEIDRMRKAAGESSP